MGGDEQQRLAALHEYRMLDAPADDELEAVVRVAAMVAGVPTATLNLIDEHRQCQLTSTGFEGGISPRSDSMCAVRFRQGEFVWVRDASTDPVYRANPWVTGVLADVRFYASAPLVTPQGHALGTLCVFDSEPRDLTGEQIARLEDLAQVILALFERRRQARINGELAAEAEARQQFTDAVLETIDVAVVAADPAGHLALFNRAARDWHGLDADPSVAPGDLPDTYRLFRTDGVTPLPGDEVPLMRALHGGAVSGAEMVIRSPGGQARHVVAGGRALTAADGSVAGAVVAMSDVTADRAQRHALEQAHAELLRSNGELEQFAAVVGHDLAAPLGVVNGYLELLGDDYDAVLDDRARKWINSATRAVARMQGLIEAMITYARAGSEPCRRQLADLGDVVDQALMDLRDRVRESGATITVPALPTLACDPTLLRQLLQNLIGNGIKYRDPGRPCHIGVGAELRDDEWLVTVTDNGLGIPADQRRRVFEMFARADPHHRAGHGIGLSTCQRIVERHGGRIWAGAAPGGTGTTISFTLPAV
ncbi:sensor histidine kinase [Actinoplanes friuliensis]|uniref:histidine kinase n=1 Tax=Actinoplanes friuliensis DSM 7358 TaxID=1246995 RepID=U5W1J4_9ACTN|nr:ATP-binding protein [Actinoplanes friuliensis]AGZ43068.1 Phytochrome A type 3 [Actinoplanes friuliensis DSM 7358]